MLTSLPGNAKPQRFACGLLLIALHPTQCCIVFNKYPLFRPIYIIYTSIQSYPFFYPCSFPPWRWPKILQRTSPLSRRSKGCNSAKVRLRVNLLALCSTFFYPFFLFFFSQPKYMMRHPAGLRRSLFFLPPARPPAHLCYPLFVGPCDPTLPVEQRVGCYPNPRCPERWVLVGNYSASEGFAEFATDPLQNPWLVDCIM